jgi:DNA repair exonuclease SbcCD ATPase subunit
MFISKLEVANWRGIAEATLQFHEGVTVVGGPNESGKSSLRAALKAALLLPTGARGEKKVLEANRPWETKHFPRVRLEFQIEGKNCAVEKEFLRPKQWASLYVSDRVVAQDDDVQSSLLQLLGPAAEWIDVLWGVQGEVTFDRAAPESIKGRLAAATNETVLPQVARLQRLISSTYTEYWTEKRGAPTKRLQILRDATMQAEREAEDLQQRISAANASIDQMEAGSRELDSLRTEHDALQKQWQTGQESLGQWESYSRAKSEAEAACSSVKSLAQWLEYWTTTIERVRVLGPAAKEWASKTEDLKSKLGTAPSRAEIDELSARLKYLELAINNDRCAEAEAIEAPTPAELKDLREKENEITRLDAKLKAGSLKARLTSESADLLVTLNRDGGAEEMLSVSSGDTSEWAAEQSFELILPGVARIEVESGAAGVGDDIARRSELHSFLTAELRKWKAQSLDQLQDRLADKEAKLRQYRKAESRQFASARKAVPDADELDELTLEDKEDLLGELPSELSVAETTWSDVQAEYQATLAEYQTLMTQNPVSEVNTILQGVDAQWRSAPIDKDEADEETISDTEFSDGLLRRLDSRTALAKKSLESSTACAAQLERALVRPVGEEVSKEALQATQQKMNAIAEKVQSLTASVNQAIGGIGGQADLHSQLVIRLESLAKSQEEEKRVELDALAIREIQQVFEASKQKLQKEVVAPLQEKVTERFSSITGRAYKEVAFDASLKPSGLATPDVKSVAIDEVSFGTREQLSLLTRLCLAELLSTTSGRQLVILDDNLVHTDELRMKEACSLMEEVARSVQIIVFTCHPERYQWFSNALQLSMPVRHRPLQKA